MKLNMIFFILAVVADIADARWYGHVITGPLGCGSRFKIRKFRGRTFAVPLDRECQVGPGSDLGRQKSPSQAQPDLVNRRFLQNWSRFMRSSSRHNFN